MVVFLSWSEKDEEFIVVWQFNDNETVTCLRGCIDGATMPEDDMWRHNAYHNSMTVMLRALPVFTSADRSRLLEQIPAAIVAAEFTDIGNQIEQSGCI